MIYRFDKFALDTDLFELRHGADPVAVEPQVIALLSHLLAHRHRVVTKPELIEKVWENRAVSDAALSSRVKTARKAIGDDGAAQRLIRTVHGLGFRFVGDVKAEGEAAADRSAAPAEAPKRLPEGSKPAIAVLPFDNLSNDPEQQYFADGIAEDIIRALAAWRYFPVVGRSVSFAYRNASVPPAQIASEIGARYVLSGSVRTSGQRLRVSLQLTDAADGRHVWSEAYDRTIEDIFEIQDQITQSVAATIAPELEWIEGRKSLAKNTDNLASWDYCQRGIALLHKFTRAGNDEARTMFQRAIELDPEYSKAFTGLAYSYHRDLFWDYAEDREAYMAAYLAAAEQAVLSDASDSSARVVHAYARIWLGDHDIAVDEARQAVRLNRGNAFAHIVLGEALDMVGNRTEAIPSAEIGVKLNERDPRVHTFHNAVARIYLSDRDYPKAEAWTRKALTQRADYPHAQLYCAVALAYQDRVEDARKIMNGCPHRPVGLGFCYRDPADNEHMRQGLLMAGWQE